MTIPPQFINRTTSLYEAIRRAPQEVVDENPDFWERAIALNCDMTLGATVPDVYVIFAEHPCYCDKIIEVTYQPCASCLSQERIRRYYTIYPNYH